MSPTVALEVDDHFQHLSLERSAAGSGAGLARVPERGVSGTNGRCKGVAQ